MTPTVTISYMGKPREIAVADALTMIAAAHKEVSRICHERWRGTGDWRTTIPAQETDTDLLIGHALSAAEAFLKRGSV